MCGSKNTVQRTRMKNPVLKNFLCCLSLRTGCLLIGLVSMVCSFSVFLSVVTINLSGPVMMTLNEMKKWFHVDWVDKVVIIEISVIGVVATVESIAMILALLLIIGAYKNRACMLTPYMVVAMFKLVLISVIGVVVLAVVFRYPMVFTLVLGTLLLRHLLDVYLVIVIHSNYTQLKNVALELHQEIRPIPAEYSKV